MRKREMKKHLNHSGIVVAVLLGCQLGCGSQSPGALDGGSADATKPSSTSDTKAPYGDTAGFSASSTRSPSDLSTAEKQALCDQIDSNQGGYDRVVQCSGSTQTTDTDQASCVAGFPSLVALCPSLTVGDLVACSAATGPDLCKYTTVAECSALRSCFG